MSKFGGETDTQTNREAEFEKAIREMARIDTGDELEVGFYGGMIILRKPEPLNTAKVRRLLKEGRKLPEIQMEDEAAVAAAVARVRRRASTG